MFTYFHLNASINQRKHTYYLIFYKIYLLPSLSIYNSFCAQLNIIAANDHRDIAILLTTGRVSGKDFLGETRDGKSV